MLEELWALLYNRYIVHQQNKSGYHAFLWMSGSQEMKYDFSIKQYMQMEYQPK